MSTLTLNSNIKEFPKALSAFGLIRDMSESELETLEILSNKKNIKFFEQSLNESQKNKVFPIETIL